jgi:hypothetical protein
MRARVKIKVWGFKLARDELIGFFEVESKLVCYVGDDVLFIVDTVLS